MVRYYALSTYMRQRYGCRVQKIPLDAGFSCPNRDGTLSTRGCIFCNPLGSGTGLGREGKSLAQQWEEWTGRMKKRYNCSLFWAYLQSYSNTHGPLEHVRTILNQVMALPDLVGLCIGTRPDCLDEQKLDLIASLPLSETWLELGLQSASNRTLQRINRGHDRQCFDRTMSMIAGKGFKTCVHIILGLPGETLEDALRTIEYVNSLPIQGIKFHNLYLCKGSTLAHIHRQDGVELLSRNDYVDWLTQCLALLRPDIVVQRLNADPRPDELLAPDWALQKSDLLNDIHSELERNDIWQGKVSTSSTPDWFSPQSRPPFASRSRQ